MTVRTPEGYVSIRQYAADHGLDHLLVTSWITNSRIDAIRHFGRWFVRANAQRRNARLFDRHNPPLPKPKNRRLDETKWSARRSSIAKMWKKDVTVHAIAETLGLSRTRVSQVAMEMGLPKRPKGGRR